MTIERKNLNEFWLNKNADVIERFDQGGKAIKRLLGQAALPCDPFTLTTLYPDHRLPNTITFSRPSVSIPLCSPAELRTQDAKARALSPPEYWLWQRLIGNTGVEHLNQFLQHANTRIKCMYTLSTRTSFGSHPLKLERYRED